MADGRQNKIFVTRDEGETFVGYNLNFSPNSIKFQSRSTPKVTEGTIPEHIIGFEINSQSVHCYYDNIITTSAACQIPVVNKEQVHVGQNSMCQIHGRGQ